MSSRKPRLPPAYHPLLLAGDAVRCELPGAFWHMRLLQDPHTDRQFSFRGFFRFAAWIRAVGAARFFCFASWLLSIPWGWVYHMKRNPGTTSAMRQPITAGSLAHAKP